MLRHIWWAAIVLSGCAPAARDAGYSPDALAGHRTSPHSLEFGYLVLPGQVARQWRLPVTDTLPELHVAEVPAVVQAAALRAAAETAPDAVRYFATGERFIAYSRPGRLVFDGLLGIYLDSAGTVLSTVELSGPGLEMCPWVGPHGTRASPAEDPCPRPYDSAWGRESGAVGETASEDSVHAAVYGPMGRLTTRAAYAAWFREARLARRRDLCTVRHPRWAEEQPFECGWLLVGIRDSLPEERPLGDLVVELEGTFDGPFDAGGHDVLIVQVPFGTERSAILRLVEDDRVRYAEPFWQDAAGSRHVE